ncbi:hypothetical protein D7Z26_00790 [Cohnella endophytica]|uniref:Pyrrolo-quinoline quinone repeat domain-containing protein n=1 Tax=Cohnella endophytica TaxID=2419778 RepID=A0A494YDI4_9BACL|nr:PQQ-binding-like beta-propeller repeat protein [Cohnella endophytica]RKP58075.1 hypothetical protein D7Z26_00790 [Cohnella endophytica]
MKNLIAKPVFLSWCVIALVCALTQPAFAEAPHSSFKGMNWTSPDTTSIVQAKWSVAIDVPKDPETINAGTVATGGGNAYVFQKGSLLAIDAKTGKTLWTYGSKLASPIEYVAGVVYTLSEDGSLHAIDAANGKKKWSTTVRTNGIAKLLVNGDKVYVYNGHVRAFDAKSGALLWTDDYPTEFMFRDIAFANGKVLVSTEISGAYMYDTLLAFDDNNGRFAWEARNEGNTLNVKDNLILVQRTSSIFDQLNKTTLDTIDLATGKVVKTVEYKEDGEAWIDSGRLYIFAGGIVYAYPLDADPSTVTRDSYRSDSSYKNYWAGGPDAGRVLFTDGVHITGSKLVNKSLVYYGSAGAPGASIARFDTIGNGLYIAYSDGRLEAKDLITAKRTFMLQMPGRVFGPTQREAGMIIVQSQGRVSAVPEPALLKGTN